MIDRAQLQMITLKYYQNLHLKRVSKCVASASQHCINVLLLVYFGVCLRGIIKVSILLCFAIWSCQEYICGQFYASFCSANKAETQRFPCLSVTSADVTNDHFPITILFTHTERRTAGD
jgi:hypothetical protein